MTVAERSAFVGLILEYITEASKPQSNLSVEFCTIGEGPQATNTFTMWQLLNLMMDHPTQPIEKCGHVPSDPNAHIAICEKCGKRIKAGELGLWAEV